MKKQIAILILIFCLSNSYGQTKFNPDSGVVNPKSKVLLSKPNFREFSGFSYEVLAGIFIPSSFNLIYYGFGFYPRYNIIAPKDWISLSIGSPSNVGIDFAAGSFGTLFRYMIDIPITMDVNLGARATKNNESLFGAFLGAGLNYDFMHIALNDTKLNINTFGPVMHGGFRWTMNGRPSGVRFSYLTGISFDDLPSNKVISFTFVYGI
jgi:hypothetical protein